MHYPVFPWQPKTKDVEWYTDLLLHGFKTNSDVFSEQDWASVCHAARCLAAGKAQNTRKGERTIENYVIQRLQSLPNSLDHPFIINQKLDRSMAEIFIILSHKILFSDVRLVSTIEEYARRMRRLYEERDIHIDRDRFGLLLRRYCTGYTRMTDIPFKVSRVPCTPDMTLIQNLTTLRAGFFMSYSFALVNTIASLYGCRTNEILAFNETVSDNKGPAKNVHLFGLIYAIGRGFPLWKIIILLRMRFWRNCKRFYYVPPWAISIFHLE